MNGPWSSWYRCGWLRLRGRLWTKDDHRDVAPELAEDIPVGTETEHA